MMRWVAGDPWVVKEEAAGATDWGGVPGRADSAMWCQGPGLFRAIGGLELWGALLISNKPEWIVEFEERNWGEGVFFAVHLLKQFVVMHVDARPYAFNAVATGLTKGVLQRFIPGSRDKYASRFVEKPGGVQVR